MTIDPAYAESVTPTLEEIAHRLWARTKGKGGQTLGTFTADTRPTDVIVNEFIAQSVNEVTSTCPSLASERYGLAREAVLIRTAMKIELAYRPEQANDSESAYYLLRAEWLDLMGGGPGGQRGSLCGSGGGAEGGLTGWSIDTVKLRGIAAAEDVTA